MDKNRDGLATDSRLLIRSVMALEATSIQKSFGGLHALRGVTARLEAGEIVGLIGPNGSGKTTLLNVLSGVYRPDGGAVRVDGVDTTRWPAHRVSARGVARTFQNIRLFPDLTVLENIHVGALSRPASRGDPLVAAIRHLGEMRLEEYRDRRAATLPYGAQRRVEIARALAAVPRYLLLDEPAAGMNELESDSLLDTIAGLRERYGFGVLVIDHDLRLIMRLCDKVLALNHGALISEGEPQQVQADAAVIEAYLGKSRERHSRPQRPQPRQQ